MASAGNSLAATLPQSPTRKTELRSPVEILPKKSAKIVANRKKEIMKEKTFILHKIKICDIN